MKITALGHSCVLLSFEVGRSAQPIRILIDPWLSDHATGDSMGRFPRLRFEMAVFEPIHAVFLSHAHCDHLDPYTLLKLWKGLSSPPSLILPISLSFLVPLFNEYLDSPDILLLEPHRPTDFRGLELMGFHDVGMEANNEDDVMVLVLSNGVERVLIETDARLALELPNFRQYISMLMRRPDLETAVFLSTENELLGTLEVRNCENATDRESLREMAFDDMLTAVHQLYESENDPDDIWQGQNVLRLIHGQGLTAPHEQDRRWQKILFPVRISDRVDAERSIAEAHGCQHQIGSLSVGDVHEIKGGRIVQQCPMPGLTLLDQEHERGFDTHLPFFPKFICAPLRFDVREINVQRKRILQLLNSYFLPYLHGLRQPPVIHLLSEYGGEYRIRVHYGTAVDECVLDYVLSFSGSRFVEETCEGAPEQEAYWANDLEDFMDGYCDEFSTYPRRQFPAEQMRLWACLATPLLNSDIVEKRTRLHFERAANGLCPGSWVMERYRANGETDKRSF